MTPNLSEHLQSLGHVIVIDDDASVRRSLCTMLERAGYEVSLYDCADAFLQNPVVPSPAVILLDMRMPGTTGVGLQSQLKTLAHNVPVIFVSGDSRPEEIIAAMKQGAVDFLLKPFSMESLVTAIENGLSRDRMRQNNLIRDMDKLPSLKVITSPNEALLESKLAVKLVVETLPFSRLLMYPSLLYRPIPAPLSRSMFKLRVAGTTLSNP